jgi:hypothetical protein
LNNDIYDPLLAQSEAQKLLPLSAAWYAKMRWKRTGPPYVTVSGRVFYRRSELLQWIEDQNQARVRPKDLVPAQSEAA